MHAAVDTLGHLPALHVTSADEQDRAQVERLVAEGNASRKRTCSWPASNYEQLSTTRAGFHYFAFARLMLAKICQLLNQS